MGLFSWKTQDTNKSIPCEGSGRQGFSVTMTDNNGNKWTEGNYEGYGEFGGKDFFELLAEMNGKQPDRDIGIDMTAGNEPFLSPNLTESKDWKWENASPQTCEFQGYFYPSKKERPYQQGYDDAITDLRKFSCI